MKYLNYSLLGLSSFTRRMMINLSTMDIVAVLTKVVKKQTTDIRQQSEQIRQLTEGNKELKDKVTKLQAENRALRAELIDKITTLQRQMALMSARAELR